MLTDMNTNDKNTALSLLGPSIKLVFLAVALGPLFGGFLFNLAIFPIPFSYLLGAPYALVTSLLVLIWLRLEPVGVKHSFLSDALLGLAMSAVVAVPLCLFFSLSKFGSGIILAPLIMFDWSYVLLFIPIVGTLGLKDNFGLWLAVFYIAHALFTSALMTPLLAPRFRAARLQVAK
jgi:hypothetical protein